MEAWLLLSDRITQSGSLEPRTERVESLATKQDVKSSASSLWWSAARVSSSISTC